MKPFNLDLALAGEPVITRNGNEVTKLHKFDVIDLDAQELYAVIDDRQIESFYLNGQWREKGESGYDLFMAEQKKLLWINIWQQLHENGNYISTVHTREDLADLEIENNVTLKHIQKLTITI
jgi:hypothetical protein